MTGSATPTCGSPTSAGGSNDRAKGRRDYAEGHMPGAVFVDLDADLAAPPGPGRHPLPSPAAFAARMAELGFDDASTIVAYDDAGGTIAARLWWMLDDLGHRRRPRARRRDPGVDGDRRRRSRPTCRRRHRAGCTLADRWSRTIDAGRRSASRLGTVALIDARAPERYRGEVEPVDAVRRPHPDGGQPAERRQPRAGRPVPRCRRPCAARFEALWATSVVVRTAAAA